MLDWLITGGASLLSGFLGMGSERKRDRENARRVEEANRRNEGRVTTMNADVRKRAERAAAVPIVTNQQQWGSVDVHAMMAGAEAAGFNPITWLRNGGMQAYARTSSSTQVYNSQLMDAALAGSTIFQESAPALETARGPGEVIGSALTAGAGAWVQEAQQERQNQFQMALLDMQLDGANRAGNVGRRSGYVPAAYLGGTVKTSKNSAVLAGGLSRNPDDLYWEYIDNSATGRGRHVWLPNAQIADSEQLFVAAGGTGPLAIVDEIALQKRWWNEAASAVSDYLGGPWVAKPAVPHVRHPPNSPKQSSFEPFFSGWW